MQFGIAEALVLAQLSRDHIRLLNLEACRRSQLQQLVQGQGLLQSFRQRGRAAGMSQEGIQLRKRHGGGVRDCSVLTAGSPGCGLAKARPSLQTWQTRRAAMRSSPSTTEPDGALPTWMRRSGAALTALIAVLFVVVLVQVRQQGQRLQALQDRLQTLENNRDLERTNALEEQLRSTVQRLQSLEGLERTLQRLSSEQESLRQLIRSGASGLGSREPQPLPAPELLPPPAPAPMPAPRP